MGGHRLSLGSKAHDSPLSSSKMLKVRGVSHDGWKSIDMKRESGTKRAGQRYLEETVDRFDNRDRNRLSASERDPSRGSAQTAIKDLSRKDTSSGNKNALAKHNLVSKLSGKLKTDSPLIDPNWENWDEDNLDYDDELMLEKKRQLLQRELEKRMAVDGGAAV